MIRRAIELYLEAVGDAVADLRYADAYGRMPEDLEGFAELRALGMQAWPQDTR